MILFSTTNNNNFNYKLQHILNYLNQILYQYPFFRNYYFHSSDKKFVFIYDFFKTFFYLGTPRIFKVLSYSLEFYRKNPCKSFQAD